MNKETETGMKKEQTFIENQFGTVTNKRVIFFNSKDWFTGGFREDIPIQNVASVRLETLRSVWVGILYLFISYISFVFFLNIFFFNPDIRKYAAACLGIIGIVCLISAILKLWGSPIVVINTAGQTQNKAAGFPWHRGEADAFVNAIRKQLFVE